MIFYAIELLGKIGRDASVMKSHRWHVDNPFMFPSYQSKPKFYGLFPRMVDDLPKVLNLNESFTNANGPSTHKLAKLASWIYRLVVSVSTTFPFGYIEYGFWRCIGWHFLISQSKLTKVPGPMQLWSTHKLPPFMVAPIHSPLLVRAFDPLKSEPPSLHFTVPCQQVISYEVVSLVKFSTPYSTVTFPRCFTSHPTLV